MKKIISVLVAISAVAMSCSAFAQFAKPEDAVKYRKAAFTVMAAHFGRLGAMATGKVPFDAKVAADNAVVVAEMAKLPWAAFGADTEGVAETKAKAEIWKHSAKFKEDADKLQAETVKLVAATKTGTEGAFKTAFASAAGTCKSCHDEFKNK